jgi:hypothetical protein
MNEIEINGRKFVALDSLCRSAPANGEDLGVRLVVLQRGWVVVGHAWRVGPRVLVTRCAVVRRWGTTKGLGEIAVGGPTNATVLDECPDVEALESEVVFTMLCYAGKWSARV